MAPKIHAVPLKDLNQSKRKRSTKVSKLKGASIKQTTENQEALKSVASAKRNGRTRAPKPEKDKSLEQWLRSDNEMRELRKQITLAIYAHENDLDKVTEIVDRLLALIQQAQKKSK